MKKLPQEKVIELLKNKGNRTYKELSELTGYHPKSLIRLNSKCEKTDRAREEKKEIIDDYLKSQYKSYKDYYDNRGTYSISYSALCKLLMKTKIDKEIVFIKKIKNKGNYYFEIIDYQTESRLFLFDSLKNDKKSFKKIFYLILSNFGAPDNISFVNFYKTLPSEIRDLLDKYNVNVLPFKSIYRTVINNSSKKSKNVSFKKEQINPEDFYNSKIRKTIDDNIVQFENTRYFIKTDSKIKKNEEIILFYNDQKSDLFIKYKDTFYRLSIYKNVESKKGNSKYN